MKPSAAIRSSGRHRQVEFDRFVKVHVRRPHAAGCAKKFSGARSWRSWPCCVPGSIRRCLHRPGSVVALTVDDAGTGTDRCGRRRIELGGRLLQIGRADSASGDADLFVERGFRSGLIGAGLVSGSATGRAHRASDHGSDDCSQRATHCGAGGRAAQSAQRSASGLNDVSGPYGDYGLSFLRMGSFHVDPFRTPRMHLTGHRSA